MNYQREESESMNPEIYCAISLSVDTSTNIAAIKKQLTELGIAEIEVRYPKCLPEILIEFAIVRYEHCWEVDHAISKMFFIVENHLSKIKEICAANNGNICIDIAIVEHGMYPALLFSQENLRKIHALDATISIDLL